MIVVVEAIVTFITDDLARWQESRVRGVNAFDSNRTRGARGERPLDTRRRIVRHIIRDELFRRLENYGDTLSIVSRVLAA